MSRGPKGDLENVVKEMKGGGPVNLRGSPMALMLRDLSAAVAALGP